MAGVPLVTGATGFAGGHLVDRLRARDFVLLDIQWVTPHLEQFGAIEIPRAAYLRRLDQALRLDCSFV